jgi:hypothetical protein
LLTRYAPTIRQQVVDKRRGLECGEMTFRYAYLVPPVTAEAVKDLE